MKQFRNVVRIRERKEIYKEKIMKKKFVRFLLNRRAFSAFVRNAENPKLNGIACRKPKHVSTIMYVITASSAWGFVASAFNWRKSPEGHEFWSALEEEWYKMLPEEE